MLPRTNYRLEQWAGRAIRRLFPYPSADLMDREFAARINSVLALLLGSYFARNYDRMMQLQADVAEIVHTINCPACHGKGKFTCTVTYLAPDITPTTESFEQRCLDCGGRGWMTEPERAYYQAMQDAWCVCEKPGRPVHFSLTATLGYTCSKCGKLLQVG